MEIIDKPIFVEDSEFEEKVLKSELPVVVEFWADWCAPCRMMAFMFDNIAKENAGKLFVYKVDIDKNTLWANRYSIIGIPTTLFMTKGKIVYRQVGIVPEPILKKIASNLLDFVGEIDT